MQIHQEMLPAPMKKMELEKSPCTWGQEGGAGLGMDMVLHPSVPSAWSNIHCTNPLPQPQHGQGNKGMGKTHPQPSPIPPEGPQANLWVPNRASPTQLVTVGTRHQGRGSPCPPAGSVLSLPHKESPSDALHSQGTAQGHRVAATTTTSIHWPPHRDHLALPAPKSAPNPSAQPWPNSSGFPPGSALP